MSGPELSPITVDLNASPSQSVTTAGLIQRHVYQTLNGRVTARLDWLNTHHIRHEEDQRLPSGMGWVSFIDGTRGAGKSTFLHTALTLLREEHGSELAVMDWIDPSRIEANEILLLVFLKALNDKVTQTACAQGKSESSRTAMNEWKRVFGNVAGALVLFSKDHHPLKELDEDLFFEIGLERAGHSASLRNNLDKLFTVACEILKVKALLFAFDDADTSAHCAIDLIETIRKYLDTPRVMIVITGDLELYSLLVRQNFRHELTRGKRDEWGTEGSGSGRETQQVRMLDHLEEQYLLKLFPLRERHHLFPLWRLIDDSGQRTPIAKVQVKTSEADPTDPKDLKTYTREKIQNGFRLTDSDTDLYTEYLLMQPIRSVLQVLSRIQEDASNDDAFALAIQDLALHHFYHYDLAAEELATGDFRTLVEAVFAVAMDDGDPDTSPYLRPSSAQPHNRGAMYGLSAALAQQLHGKPSTCIAYLLRGPGMVKLMHDAANSNLRKLDDKVLQQEFKRYMGVGKVDDALGWARLATVALVSEHAIAHTYRVVRYGIVGLNQDSTEGFQGYRKVFKGMKIAPAAAFSLVNSSGTGTRTFASIYNVLGLMGRLLELSDAPEWPDMGVNEKEKNIRSALSGFYPSTKSISVPPWIAITNTDNDDDEPKVDLDDEKSQRGSKEEQEQLNAWVEPLLAWLEATRSVTDHIKPSSVFMGKVWPHLFFGLENISDALRPQSGNALRDFPKLMELFALCVVNAFLTEESSYHLAGTAMNDMKPISLDNPRSSAHDYLRRINKVAGQLTVERLPLTYIVATCPLITGLLSQDKISKGGGWPFQIGTQALAAWFIDSGDWDKLIAIAIQGKKPDGFKPPMGQETNSGATQPNENQGQ